MIPEKLYQTVENDLAAEWPEESCGLLTGGATGSHLEVTGWHPQQNRASNPRRTFELDPMAVLKVEREAEQRNDSLLGFVHSHPNCPAIPSEQDRHHARNWPGMIWWIARCDQNDDIVRHRCWMLDKQELFFEIPMQLIA